MALMVPRQRIGRPTAGSPLASEIVAEPGAGLLLDITGPGGCGKTPLLEAVALAGGLTRIAKGSESRLIRRSLTGREELMVDLQKVLYGGGPDMLLTDGDIVFVPTSMRKEYTQQIISAAIGTAVTYGVYRLAATQ